MQSLQFLEQEEVNTLVLNAITTMTASGNFGATEEELELLIAWAERARMNAAIVDALLSNTMSVTIDAEGLTFFNTVDRPALPTDHLDVGFKFNPN